MNGNYLQNNVFTEQDIQDLNVELKIGVLGTINPEGLPHLSLISSIQPYQPRKLVWGQFTEGTCKKNVLTETKTGFLIMSLGKEVWRGTADYQSKRRDGPEYGNYNNMNMFRYNAYFGVHTVHYMDLVTLHPRQALPMGKVIRAAVTTMIARFFAPKHKGEGALNQWSKNLLKKVDNLKFLGYVGDDGYPKVIPVIQLQSLDSNHLIFSLGAYGYEIEKVPQGEQVCMLGMSFSMEDVLTRGKFLGVQTVAGIRCGVLEVDWVYNPMPPIPGQIYPKVALT